MRQRSVCLSRGSTHTAALVICEAAGYHSSANDGVSVPVEELSNYRQYQVRLTHTHIYKQVCVFAYNVRRARGKESLVAADVDDGRLAASSGREGGGTN